MLFKFTREMTAQKYNGIWKQTATQTVGDDDDCESSSTASDNTKRTPSQGNKKRKDVTAKTNDKSAKTKKVCTAKTNDKSAKGAAKTAKAPNKVKHSTFLLIAS